MVRPLLKEFTRVIEPGKVTLVREPGVETSLPDPEGQVLALLRLLDGTRTIAELSAALSPQWPALTPSALAEQITAMDRAGLLEDADADSSLSQSQRERYVSNLGFFSTYADLTTSRYAFQERLCGAHVVVLGVGGLGSTVLFNLAGLGVGRITMLDYDTIEKKNLVRQFLYSEAEVGMPKLERAAARLRSLNSTIEIVTVERMVAGPADVAPLLQGADLVICGIDTPQEAFDWVNQACVEAQVPYIVSGMQVGRGVHFSVDPGKSGCLRCRQMVHRRGPQPDRTVEQATRVNRAMGPAATILGAFSSMEVMRFLTGFAPPISAGKVWFYDFATGTMEMAVPWERQPDCPVCAHLPWPEEAAAPEPAESLRLTPASRLTFRPLSVVPEDGEFLVGNAELGVFVTIPEVGVRVLQHLQQGASIQETATAFAKEGVEVDVLDFATEMLACGFVTGADGQSLSPASAEAPKRWLEWVPPEVARPLFSRPAWLLYGLLFLLSLFTFVRFPEYWPQAEDFFFYPNPAVSIGTMFLLGTFLTASHEVWHWLAARAVGIAARFSVSRRLFVLVFQTDLSQLWAHPRQVRYGPMLAGMAFDITVVGLCLALRLAGRFGLLELAPLLERLMAAVLYTRVLGLLFQLLVFLRTDLYAVLVNWLGCSNLYRVTYLSLLRRVWRLTDAQRKELADAHPRDLQVARWFVWVFGAGVVLASYVMLVMMLPGTVIVTGWVAGSLRSANLLSAAFWEGFVIALVGTVQILAPLAVFVWERIQVRRGQTA